MVESHADKLVAHHVIRVTNERLIFQQDDDDLSRVRFGVLVNRQTVEVWWTEPTTGTFPVLGTAGQVVIR